MLTRRIIPCLDVDEGRVVKGTRFRDLKDAGDPEELARLYDEQGADELVLLDVGATVKSRKIMLDVVERVSRRIFIPLTAGGGIGSIKDMRDLLNAGADKVSICSAALRRPEILGEGAALFGSQCLVLSLDAGLGGKGWFAHAAGGRENTGIDAIEWAKRAVGLGAGEILLNSIDRDGTRSGYDIDLTRRVSEAVPVPVIASGGAGRPEQMLEVLTKGRADAVLAASILHFRDLTVRDIKAFLRRAGVNVR